MGRWVLLGLLALAAVLVALVVLALPFRGVRDDAEAARAELVAARAALEADQPDVAAEHAASAREHVAAAQDAVGGLGGAVWTRVPVAGSGVRDVRHLVSALDQATEITEIGVTLYPQVLGRDASLVHGDDVDLAVLTDVADDGTRAADLAAGAVADLEAVSGEAPVVGAELARLRDEALAEIGPLDRRFAAARPALEVLPRLLGAEGETKYLVAILNPAELRYSGGATLGLSTMRLTDGRATFEDLGNYGEAGGVRRMLYWKKVPGNPFHQRGKQRFQNATFSPYWSVSGEELLRAWAKLEKEEYDGVIAVDVTAIADLIRITGPVETEGYGMLTADNAVRQLVGSYDQYPDPAQRQRLNDAVLPIFRDRFLSGGRFSDKLTALGDAADARHVAVYLRDPDAQAVVEDLGIQGDLSDTTGDYLGVFTQNVNAAKVDYYQQRELSSQVQVREDGSASVELTTTLNNSTPPYAGPFPDDGEVGYFTRWSKLSVATFLPLEGQIEDVTVDGVDFDPVVRNAQGRPYFTAPVVLEPGGTARVVVRYELPAGTFDDGYTLDFDPQGTVNPAHVTVQVDGPARVVSAPDGWQVEGRTATLPPGPQHVSTSWAIDFG